MLAIRLQRVGRAGYPTYRLAVQEAQRHPSSGRVVAYVGSYNPHTKDANVQVELAQKYLDNGAQPTPRVVKLLKEAGVKLPKWVKEAAADKQKALRNPEKLRKNQPKEEEAPEVETPADEAVEETAPADEA
ncbi:TPA: 30S ribosomal protein S16 [Candidatus Saccharibacteria bacterium]|nr:30S ribosomal protein S16 [Candidatus Saccharibacteria bacterium]|tara:strand:- start:58 stop:450 length:393 start_codon:yes stop_codon:yes gene_type:complete